MVLKLQSDIEAANAEIKSLKSNLNEANNRIDELQQYTRKNNLRIYGIKENPQENTDAVVISMCSEKIGVNINSSDISISHRLKSTENGVNKDSD